MKKITFLICAMVFCVFASAQCINTIAYLDVASNNTGEIQQVSGCTYSVEYTAVNSLIIGDDYVFGVVNLTSGLDTYVTVTDASDVVIAHGPSPLTINAITVDAVRMHVTEDDMCTGGNNCHVLTVQDLTAAATSCFDPTGFNAINLTSTSADLTWASGGSPNEVDFNVEVYLAGESAALGNTPIFADANVMGTTVSLTGLEIGTAYDAYITAACSGATANSGLVGPLNFSTTAECPAPTGLQIFNPTSTSIDLGFLTGAAENMWEIEIVDITAGGSATGEPTIFNVTFGPWPVTGLEVANQYEAYVRANCALSTPAGVGQSTWTGPIAFTTLGLPPENDECTAAVALTVNEDLNCAEVTSGTVNGATNSGVDNCFGTEDDDVWYSFVATGTTHQISLINLGGSTTDLYHAVYDADPGCEALGAALTCSDPNVSTTANLIIGNTYYVQVYTWTGTPAQTSTFDICVGSFPPCLVPTAGSGAPMQFGANLSWTDNNGSTSWNIEWGATGFVQGAGTLVESVATNPYPLESLAELTTYDFYVQSDCGVDGTSEWAGPFTFTTTGPPPANDNVCDAEVLTVGAAPVPGDMTDSTFEANEVPGSCWAFTSVPNSVWYSFVAPSAGVEITTDFVTTFNDTQMTLYTLTDCTDLTTATEIGCSEDDGATGNGWMSVIQTSTLTAGTTYYVQIDGYGAGVGAFEIQVNLLPLANDECANAEALTLGMEITADNTGATDSMVAGDCFTGTISDLWYSFVAGAGLEVEITTTASQYGVYSDCAGTEVVACNTSLVTGLTEGTTYYVRVNDDGTVTRSQAPGSFTLTVAEPTAGTDEFNSDSLFSYYPNPVTDNLTLKAQKEISNVSVYNMIGQEVYRNEPNTLTNEVNMSSLQAGAYFVKVTINNITETIKVIKR